MTLRLMIVITLFGASLPNARAGVDDVPDPRVEEAITLMMDFAERTGLTTGQATRRYLWTDAFAVCNFLGLARATGEQRYHELAVRLIGQVHQTLGRHRADDPRTGWISGLDPTAGEAHPTRGGLRIGKGLPERGPGEPFNERLEWDRDGQYFHYLSKWMHALDQAARASGRPEFNVWARELAASAHGAFTYLPGRGGARRMYWKMSVDLSRPLVPSMGQHDPLDGYITSIQLRTTAAILSAEGEPDLEQETREFAAMIDRESLATSDQLGLGGLMMEATRVEQLMRQGVSVSNGLLEDLLSAALTGLEHYARTGAHQLPVTHRLAFRELGLAIGLFGVVRMHESIEKHSDHLADRSTVRELLAALRRSSSLGVELESFWRVPAHQQAASWTEHLDINSVMLATSLVPEGSLALATDDTTNQGGQRQSFRIDHGRE